MLTNQGLKLKTNKKKLFFPNFSLNTSQNIALSFFKKFNLNKIKNSKKRNISLIKENKSLTIKLQKKLNIHFITKLSNHNKLSRNKSKIKLRNQKIIDYSSHYSTEFNDNTNNKISAETTTTAITSKRNFISLPKTNLTKLNNKLTKESFRKIKYKIYDKFNSLKGTSLHFHNKTNLDEGYVITEESIFNSKISSSYQNKSTSQKSLKSIISSFENVDISLNYSDDTDTKRFHDSKKKLNDFLDNCNRNNYNGYSRNYLNKNNTNNNNSLTYNINKIKSNKDNDNNDFLTFCEEMNRKLFGKLK